MVEFRQSLDVVSSKLLIAAGVNEQLSAVLGQIGYHVEQARSGPEALALLESTPFDLMILDMAIPGMSGVEVMLRARLMRRDLPIIVLTAQASVESALAAVKVGVVDYMLKPCNGDDLTLTIARALEERAEQLRHQHLLNMIGEAMNTLHQSGEASAPLPLPPRPASVPAEMAAQDIERVGVIALDRQKRQVTLKSDPPRTVELTEGEMSILAAMMERPNQVFTCNQLARAAFGYDGMDKWTVESVVRSCVFRLRSKIEPDSDAPRLICTVRGRGYYFSPA